MHSARHPLCVRSPGLLSGDTKLSMVPCRVTMVPQRGLFLALALFLLAPIVARAECGDGDVQTPEEQCDDGNTTDGDCCSSSCQFEPPSVECRSSTGACDIAEFCTGASGECPADTKSLSECRAAAGDCDVAESCDGVGDDCPADGFRDSSVECRAAGGVCDLAENCTGSSPTCPADLKSTAECRGTAGDCDVAESCDGVGDDCPADGFRDSSVECRAAGGVCDLAENCTGSSPTCPADLKSTAECRGAAGGCD